MTHPKINLEKLRELAERATKGPIRPYDNFLLKDDGARGYILAEFFGANPMTERRNNSNDTHYYAAASPDTILTLVDALRDAREALDLAVETAGGTVDTPDGHCLVPNRIHEKCKDALAKIDEVIE